MRRLPSDLSHVPHADARTPHAAATMLAPPLVNMVFQKDSSRRGEIFYLPALRISLLPKRDFNVNQDFKFSQLSLPQQQATAESGSGEGTREKLAKAVVMSSIVLFAWWRLLAKGDSGVTGRLGSNGFMVQ